MFEQLQNQVLVNSKKMFDPIDKWWLELLEVTYIDIVDTIHSDPGV